MIEEIKKGLAIIESSNWEDYTNMIAESEDTDGFPYVTFMGKDCVNVARNTPEWLRYLIGEVELWKGRAEVVSWHYEQINIKNNELRIALEDVADYQHRWSDSPITEVQKIASKALGRKVKP